MDPSLVAAGVEGGVEFGAGFGSKGPVPPLPGQGPPGFEGSVFGVASQERGVWAGLGGAGPYPAQGGGFAELLQEIRAGNQNVDAKFGMISAQFATVQNEIAQIKADMVTKHQFESLQDRVSKLEKGGGTGDSKALHAQLDRLDPANRSLAFYGICDINLERRTRKLEAILTEAVGCPKCIGIDHIHKGKRDERTPTKVSIVEFRNRSDREVAFRLLSGKQLTDDTEAKVSCKRARTGLQKQRNDKLIKANDVLKQNCVSQDLVQIDWKERRVLVNATPAFVQGQETAEGSFLPPFVNLAM